MRRQILAAITLTLAALAALAASAHEIEAGGLTLSKLHVRASLAGAQTTAGYVVVSNPGSMPDRLVSVSCACAARASLHDMAEVGGVMRMRPAAGGFVVPAKGALTLAPGGKHVMLTGLMRPLKDGERVPLVLTFEQAGRVEADFHVMTKPGGADPKPGSEHAHH